MTPLIGSTFASQVQRYNRKETGPGQYYWHFYQKRRYSHFTDSQGNHWYGGASDEANHKWAMLLWKNGRFWWHDTNNDRWLYYYKTYWWAQDDQNPSMVDVYLNGNYYPCDRTGLIQIPQATQGRWDSDHQRRGRDKRDEDRAHTGGQGDDRGKDWKHQDGQKDRAGANDNNNAGSRDLGESKYYDPAKTRLVTVSGTNRDAFLYDVTPAHTLDHVYLISNVADVQFANDATGKAWMITFILQDGTRKGYNADGHLTMP
jgi:hypothetical protein